MKKPVVLDLHCFQLSLYLVSDCFEEFMNGISKVRAKLISLCIICSLGQVKLSLDKYIYNMAFYLYTLFQACTSTVQAFTTLLNVLFTEIM